MLKFAYIPAVSLFRGKYFSLFLFILYYPIVFFGILWYTIFSGKVESSILMEVSKVEGLMNPTWREVKYLFSSVTGLSVISETETPDGGIELVVKDESTLALEGVRETRTLYFSGKDNRMIREVKLVEDVLSGETTQWYRNKGTCWLWKTKLYLVR